MGARTKARKRALDLLFASEMRGRLAVEALEEELSVAAEGGRPVPEYAATLVRGVGERAERIDEVLASYSRGWTLDRMPSVDRNVLRIAVWELLFSEDVPGEVAVSEALGLVRDLSTDESPSFVNGILASVLRDRAELVAG